MRRAISAVMLLGLASSPLTPALSPKGDAIIVKTDNASAEVKTCAVSCRFATGQGSETITCTHPPGVRAWYVCLRPTDGKAFGQLQSGSENCK
jgi:hypothetical protein